MLAPVQQDCNFPCAGNKLQYCGGSGRLQLYTANSSSASPPPTTVPNTNKSTGLGNYTGSQVVGISIAGIVGLLVFIFLGKYRRWLLARIPSHRYQPPQPPPPSIPMQDTIYATDLSDNITSIKPSKQTPSSKRSVNSSLYRFTDDLHLTNGGFDRAGPSVHEQDGQQLKPPENARKVPDEEVPVLKASETVKSNTFPGVYSRPCNATDSTMNKCSREGSMEAGTIKNAEVEVEAEKIQKERIKNG